MINIYRWLIFLVLFLSGLESKANSSPSNVRLSAIEPCQTTITAVSGSVLTASVNGNNTSPEYTTQFVLLDGSDAIVAGPQSSGIFVAPSTSGAYKIISVNYSGIVNGLSPGSNINNLSGECFEISAPKCYDVQSSDCTTSIPAYSGATLSANVSGNNTSAGFTTQFVLLNSSGQIVAGPQSTGSFTAPATEGVYRIVSINSSGLVSGLLTGQNISGLSGDCFAVSAPKCFQVTSPPFISCIPVFINQPISTTVSGNNTASGYITQFVLLNSSGVIITGPQNTGSFTSPATVGKYSIVAVNYSGTVSGLTVGQNISAISGDCFAISLPKCFEVTVPPVIDCTDVFSGADISATATGHNISAGFATQYVLTTAAGVILNSNTTGSFTAPTLSGEVRIYAVNYETAGAQPVFTNGINISAIGGDCVDVSAVPKCFTITICEKPTLSVGGKAECTATGWSFTVSSNGSIQVPAGATLSGNTVTVPVSMAQVAITATNSCGETSETIRVSSPVCPVVPACEIPITLSVGTPVTFCNGTTASYSVSFSSNGNVTASVGTVQGNSVINIPVGTAVTLTATLSGCSDRTVEISSPVVFTCPVNPCDAVNPGISYSLSCNNNGTYSINYITSPGVTVISSAGSFVNLTGNVTLTVTKDACNTSKQIQITAPQCVVCQQPVLSVGRDIACTTNGWSFTVNSNGTVQVPAGVTLTGNTVNVPSTMTQVAVYASNGCGETSETISISKPTCPVPTTCETPITLNAGSPVTSCTANGAVYSVSFSSNATVTASAGTVQGNAVINIPVGTAVTLTASNATCPAQVITVSSPASFTCPIVDPCNDKNPGISYSLSCNGNGTYSINYTAASGTVVTSSAGSFTNLTGNVTLTITEAGCTTPKTIQITAPQCVVCQQPVLSLGGDISCTTTGWSFTVNSNGTVQVLTGVTLTGNTVNVPSRMTQVAVYASNGCGETSETISISKPTCPVPATCETPITLNAGSPVTSCTANGAVYSVSFSSNATVTASAGTVQGNVVINIPVGIAVTLTASNATCPSQVITVNSPATFTCPIVDPCNDKNPGISYSLSCNGNGTYSINYTAASGTVVTSSANSFTNLTGNVTLTITEAGCNAPKTIQVTAPQCVPSGDLALVKTAAVNNTAGSITYTFTVTNTGEVTLNTIALTDPLLGSPVVLNSTTLLPGASATGYAVYTITEADRLQGSVTNTATVTGRTPNGTTVTDKSGSTIDNDDPTVTLVPKCPAGVKCLTATVTKR